MARDERLDRQVAVKIVPLERVMGGRFEREARAAARLSHPGIVTLYEPAADADAAYLVSELVRGGTLQQLLEEGRVSDRDVVVIAISLCEALSYAHTQGVVHRDVKPSNVLIPERPSSPAHPAKLTDFGVARLIGGDLLTRTGDVVGTAAYMAPEQAEGREAGRAADLYSLAVVTYEALTGVNPVRTGTAAMHARRLGAHVPPLRRRRSDLPRELGCGIDLALRPRPRERGTLDELHESLSISLERVSDTPVAGAVPLTRRSIHARAQHHDPAAENVPDQGAWPAFTARITASAWRRAALAATGWLWLALAAPLAAADLYTGRPPGTPQPDVWTSSLATSAETVIRPIATSGVLAGALVWALAALVLPWLVTGRSLPRDIVLVSAWAAMTVSATEATIAMASSTHTVSAPPTAVVGAVVGSLIALAPSAHRARQQSRNRVNPGPELP